MNDYTSFRQKLDAIVRTLDVKQVRELLIAEKQWDEEKPDDPEFAMWMMVAGSPTLLDLHERAYDWLMSHGHEDDAKVYLARDKKQGAKSDGRQRSSGKPKSKNSRRDQL